MPWPVTRKPGNSRSQEQADQVFQHHEADRRAAGRSAGRRMKRSTCAGSGISAAHAVPVLLALQQQRHHQAHVGDERERMRRVDRQRRQHREHPLHEPGVEPGPVVGGQRRRRRRPRCRPRAAAPRSSRQTRCCSASSASARCSISASCCAGVRPSGERAVDAGLGLADQAGDADRVELVEVGGADRDEAQPLQQRMARVLRLLHHAVVEVEPGQLAVDEAVRAVRRDRRDAPRSRRGLLHEQRRLCRQRPAGRVRCSWRRYYRSDGAVERSPASATKSSSRLFPPPAISQSTAAASCRVMPEPPASARDRAAPPPRAASPACAAGAAAASPAPFPARRAGGPPAAWPAGLAAMIVRRAESPRR